MISIIVLLFRLWCTPVVTPDTIILPGDFPMAVIQQLKGDYLWVSDERDSFTQLEEAQEEFGTNVFALHTWGKSNDLYYLKVGDFILYREKSISSSCVTTISTKIYQVKAIYRYQAVRPRDPETPLVGLVSGRIYSANQVVKDMYGDNKTIVFQTCIYKNGNTAWGRLFIIAE